mmetsp:Transcript_8618/g.26182  ORF Transcript_8618/g.26182 Transcript_8618/m.26182 type:complete len:151 (+) Transcript_8618:1528-1980(+)
MRHCAAVRCGCAQRRRLWAAAGCTWRGRLHAAAGCTQRRAARGGAGWCARRHGAARRLRRLSLTARAARGATASERSPPMGGSLPAARTAYATACLFRSPPMALNTWGRSLLVAPSSRVRYRLCHSPPAALTACGVPALAPDAAGWAACR